MPASRSRHPFALGHVNRNGFEEEAYFSFSYSPIRDETGGVGGVCQSAFKLDPGSASNFDPFGRRVLAVALAPSELVGVAETVRARAA